MRVVISRFVERNSRKDHQIRPPRRPPTGGRDRLAVPFLHRFPFYRRLRRQAQIHFSSFLTVNSSIFHRIFPNIK
ncbi:hypothetical protein TNCV_2200681 [Trichonephila clavipes]|nr:hypothetical protein TNCV_686641 [Trichonephila clavipes]GFU93490.1 hypothetical protein TNCV_2200681 [Trichonephila clavipes]